MGDDVEIKNARKDELMAKKRKAHNTVNTPESVNTDTILHAIATHGTCPDHPRYRKKRQPRTTCGSCWVLWFMLGLADGTLKLEIGSQGR